MKAKVLLVEDNADLAAGICYNLRREGYDVRQAELGRKALDIARQWDPDLMILDLMLPDLDGYQVLRAARAKGLSLPVLVLTARGEESDKVRAFQLDADQYVTKPFGLMELLERVRTLLRRHGASHHDRNEQEMVSFGDVELRATARTVYKAGRPVDLSPKAFDLLLALVRNEGRAMSRLSLLQEVWGHIGAVQTRTVDWHVSELRGKLEDNPDSPRFIATVWKIGYRFDGKRHVSSAS